MYDELVNILLYDAGWLEQGMTQTEHDIAEHLKKAADAIEELSRMEQDFRQYISDQVNREKGVYACCYCKHRESTNKYEPGCTLEKCDGVSGWAWGVPKEEA